MDEMEEAQELVIQQLEQGQVFGELVQMVRRLYKWDLIMAARMVARTVRDHASTGAPHAVAMWHWSIQRMSFVSTMNPPRGGKYEEALASIVARSKSSVEYRNQA